MTTTINVTTEQQSFNQYITSKLIEECLNESNDIELDDLELIIKVELAQGMPSDTELVGF